ncbi:MAG: bifunctional glycosyltransferase family 2 protein/class I SAM-dependent methyltransferase [Candidatus Cohnella colombiensis]|uniref:Bifunctional glycosyltransferase family 2 protein/class I SAM-dependent methyltransferase n=1 Tax=Candidatus Cohnella colombiensis TaxID=3121368 RepID=A0AA95JFL2_9BACL|nr:MAG: bifunctional glycosyltransferase family 2 protein/class I SAM-dependent methyltransferase [Cohnella sp.]
MKLSSKYMRKTSIVILTFNQLDDTKACIDSIRRFTERGTYELIVVDNLSTDGTREWLAEQRDILTIYNDENVGFPKGNNMGINVAAGDSILLLNNSVIVTENWLSLMDECLYSSDRVGAVGPITNSAYSYQDRPVHYSSVDEMLRYARANNISDASKWEPRIKLIGFAMLIKREVIEQIGLMDEQYSPRFCEDSDYSVRILKAGYQLMLCNNVFIHHNPSVSSDISTTTMQEHLTESRNKFRDKWGFSSTSEMDLRPDLRSRITAPKDKAIRVLDVGCACGAALLELKYHYPNAELHGVENNRFAAEIANLFAQIYVGDVEEGTPYTDQYFDYILLGNVLEQIVDPLAVLKELRRLLKPGGELIAGIFNASFYQNVHQLMIGRWTYTDSGHMSKANIRYYTKLEINDLFQQAGFSKIDFTELVPQISDQDVRWIEQASRLTQSNQSHMRVVQYVCQVMKEGSPIKDQSEAFNNLNNEQQTNEALEYIGQLVKEGQIDCSDIIEAISQSKLEDKPHALNQLAVYFYKEDLFLYIIPLLQHALVMTPGHRDSIYNMAFILHKAGGNDQALQYLNLLAQDDDETKQLREEIMSQE